MSKQSLIKNTMPYFASTMTQDNYQILEELFHFHYPRFVSLFKFMKQHDTLIQAVTCEGLDGMDVSEEEDSVTMYPHPLGFTFCLSEELPDVETVLESLSSDMAVHMGDHCIRVTMQL